MIRPPPSTSDQGARRAREAIVAAFAGLALSHRYGKIRVAEIILNANVARSTFYEHFRGKDDLLLTAIAPILLPLASAGSGRASRAHLRSILAHLWEKRALARIILDSAAAPLLQRRLATMIAARLDEETFAAAERTLLSRAAAAGQLSMLRMWLAGEVSCTTELLTTHLLEHTRVRGAGLPPGT